MPDKFTCVNKSGFSFCLLMDEKAGDNCFASISRLSFMPGNPVVGFYFCSKQYINAGKLSFQAISFQEGSK
jgi:hypothetical protein